MKQAGQASSAESGVLVTACFIIIADWNSEPLFIFQPYSNFNEHVWYTFQNLVDLYIWGHSRKHCQTINDAVTFCK